MKLKRFIEAALSLPILKTKKKKQICITYYILLISKAFQLISLDRY